jgi:hypothetical protein
LRVPGLRVAELQNSGLGNLGFQVLRLASARIRGSGFDSLKCFFLINFIFEAQKAIPGLDEPLILDNPQVKLSGRDQVGLSSEHQGFEPTTFVKSQGPRQGL